MITLVLHVEDEFRTVEEIEGWYKYMGEEGRRRGVLLLPSRLFEKQEGEYNQCGTCRALGILAEELGLLPALFKQLASAWGIPCDTAEHRVI